MARVVVVLAAIAVLAVGFNASAQSRKCPEGYYYNEEIGKCVLRRGSG